MASKQQDASAFEQEIPPTEPNIRSRMPTIAVSASLSEEQRKELINYGMDGWILKPIDFRRLNELYSE